MKAKSKKKKKQYVTAPSSTMQHVGADGLVDIIVLGEKVYRLGRADWSMAALTLTLHCQ